MPYTRHIVGRVASIHNVILFEFADQKSVDYAHPRSKVWAIWHEDRLITIVSDMRFDQLTAKNYCCFSHILRLESLFVYFKRFIQLIFDGIC